MIQTPIGELPPKAREVAEKALKVRKNEKGFYEAEFLAGIVMTYIPEGEFIMGGPGERNFDKAVEAVKAEGWVLLDDHWVWTLKFPVRRVFLDGYWIGKFPVTFAQIDVCPDLNPIDDAGFGRGLHPAINLSWQGAVSYSEWLVRKTGVGFRLPTEAEWEKAARGTDGRKYPWGDEEPNERLANFNNSIGKNTEVGKYPDGASPYGCLDMAGNAWEWCNDWYDEEFYGHSPRQNPQGPATDSLRVQRGGGLFFGAGSLLCANRSGGSPAGYWDMVGFRLAAGSVEK